MVVPVLASSLDSLFLSRERHLDFFQSETELVARVPRVKTPDGKVLQIKVPWARPGNGFTLLFQARNMLPLHGDARQ